MCGDQPSSLLAPKNIRLPLLRVVLGKRIVTDLITFCMQMSLWSPETFEVDARRIVDFHASNF
jgi:hypothetical protein